MGYWMQVRGEWVEVRGGVKHSKYDEAIGWVEVLIVVLPDPEQKPTTEGIVVDAVTLLNRLVSDAVRLQGQGSRVWGCKYGGGLHGCVDQGCEFESIHVDSR